MKYQLVLQVDEDDQEEDAAPEGGDAELRREAVAPEGQQEQQAGGGLDQQDPEGDMRPAGAAAAPEAEIAGQGDVLVPREGAAAGIAVGGRPQQRPARRQAIDADVEKAADSQAGQGKENGERNIHHL